MAVALLQFPTPAAWGRGPRLHPHPSLCSLSASLPSRCPCKALSGRKFDYRVFAALPSSRPVYDMQVPGHLGPSAGRPCTVPATFPPVPVTQPIPPNTFPVCLCRQSCSLGVGPAPSPTPQPDSLGGFRQAWARALTQPFSPSQSPDFAEELRSLEPSPSPGELVGQFQECPQGAHPPRLTPLHLPSRPAGGWGGGHGASGRALTRCRGPRGGDTVQQPPPHAARTPWPGPSALLDDWCTFPRP